jgi:hypothetical protein
VSDGDVEAVRGLNSLEAAQEPCATYINVAFFLETKQLEVAEHGEAVVLGVVVVPKVSVWVDGKDIVGLSSCNVISLDIQ